VDYTLVVPSDAPVMLDVDSGDVDTRSLDGPLTVRIGHGELVVENHGASLVAEVDSGRVRGRNLESTDLTIATVEAPVDIVLESAPVNLLVESVTADITIVVPSLAYQIDVSSEDGKVEVMGLQNEQSVPRHIEVYSDSGDIDVLGSR
jgi:DUF4097 and DUF4098 domain-containing protein YvlB